MEKQFLLRQDCGGAILGTLGLVAIGCARLSSPPPSCSYICPFPRRRLHRTLPLKSTELHLGVIMFAETNHA
jgi:hypothetical protein